MSRAPMVLVLMAGMASLASASIEPILFTGGPIPGVPGATIWQTGLYRPAWSPTGERWAIRVDRTSATGNEYVVAGSGVIGSAVIHSRATNSPTPAGIASVFYHAERGLAINDSGVIALSGSTTTTPNTDTIWRFTPGSPGTLEIVARELDGSYLQPNGEQFRTDIGGPQIANTGEVVFAMSDTRTEASDRDAIFLWSGTANSYLELLAEGATVLNPELSGRTVEDINIPEANATPSRGSVQFFRDSVSEVPVFGFWGDLTGSTSDDKALFVLSPSGVSVAAREGTIIDGVAVNSSPSVVGWVDHLGNAYAVSGGSFGTPASAYGFINGQKVLNAGEPVGGSVAGENWTTAGTTLLLSSVIALHRLGDGSTIVGGHTTNSDATRNQVIIHIASNGTRTELVRTGDTVDVVVAGSPQTRTITTLSQQDAGFASFASATHFYFVAGTTPLAGTTPADLFARVALPTAGCPCPIDYNESGSQIPDIDDLLAFFEDFNSGADSADVDCTGAGSVPDIDDLLFFFEAFNGTDRCAP